jgi:hypothetical protein
MKELFVFGHRRSGNHFLMESIKLNFGWDEFYKDHCLFDGDEIEPDGSDIYIVRDGRDVMVACFHWWSLQKGSQNVFLGRSFSDFLHGKIYVNNPIMYDPDVMNPVVPEMFADPIGYWVQHTIGWKDKVFTVRYEDLNYNPVSVLEIIEREFGFSRKNEKLEPLRDLVGHAPRKGSIGDWKTYFNEEDLDLFWDKAAEAMKFYGYGE